MTRETTTRLAIVTLVAIALSWFFFGRRDVREVSPLGYQYATALYTACNQCDGEKLDALEQLIEESTQKAEIGAEESQWLAAIVQQGRRGEWESAAEEIRGLMMDQVRGS